MCGIVGIVGSAPVAPRLVDALKRLEYRGYDSAGVATLEGGAITRCCAVSISARGWIGSTPGSTWRSSALIRRTQPVLAA